MVMIEVGSPKIAREMFCRLEHQVNVTQMHDRDRINASIADIIAQLDVHRPLGSNGKHGNLHTTTCGCEDV